MNTALCEEISQLIPACLRDELTPDETARVAAHLDVCQACQARLEQTAARAEDWQQLPPCGHTVVTPNPPESGDESNAFGGSLADFAVHFLAPATAPDAIGELDDIEILGIVGRGGMGVVLKGRQTSLQRLVAVKLLRPELAEQAVSRKRFIREAQAMAAVVHPNVLPIHSVRMTGRLPYLVMPFLDCESLEQRLQRVGTLDVVDVLTIGLQVARGLEAAHAQGLVHRDVKPGNILLERSGPRVWLADFGLARAGNDVTLTVSGLIAGTPLFMSPEQARGESITDRSDLFSLGSVIYMMCTGHPPFRAETPYGVILRICESRPRALRSYEPSLPDWLQRLVDWLHKRDPDDRPESAADVVAILEQTLRACQRPESCELPWELTEAADDDENDEHPWTFRGALSPLTRPAWLVGLAGGLLMITLTGSLLLLTAAGGLPEQADVATVPAPPTLAEPDFAPVPPDVEPLVIAQASAAGSTPVRNDTPYASSAEAYRLAAAFLAQKEYAKSRQPLEAAVKLAPDDADRVKYYRALIPAYTMADDWQLKANALDFIITHAGQSAERSLARTDLLGFVRQRGKTKELVQRYEKRLQQQPDDEVALYILSEAYARLTDEPQKAATLLERMAALKKVAGEEPGLQESAQLAEQYVKARKYKVGAELFEALAKRDQTLAAWHHKEAGLAWLKAKENTRALAAAKASAASPPEQRSQLLQYFWQRGLADLFTDLGEPALAIPHYEQALAQATIDGYRKETEQRLARARELVK